MGGGGQNQKLLAANEQQANLGGYGPEWEQRLMDDVQFGSRAPRLPLPYRAIPGPQFDPKTVPIAPSGISGQPAFDPSASQQDFLYLAQGTGGGGSGGINEQQLPAILNRLGYGGNGGINEQRLAAILNQLGYGGGGRV